MVAMTLSGNIFITGGTGSLGNAIVRRAERDGWPCQITIYSRSELLQAQMRSQHPHCRYVLGDVRDVDRLAAAMAGHQTVIHAAAMKRIPEAEAQPDECYLTNVQGSLNVARAAINAGVQRVVGISTDKACRATTAYGASKLAMEKIFQAQPSSPTIFTLVRYGNVVASRGSVIPIWQVQAARGEPLTITHAEMTRFWMSIESTVDLVLLGLQGKPGEIWVKKMPALPVIEIARAIWAGSNPGKLKFIVTGLRSDEKLHEDLIHSGELVWESTDHYIIVAKPDTYSIAQRGAVYRSNIAPQLTGDEFLDMLRSADYAPAQPV